MPERRSALAECRRPGRHGAAGAEAPLIITEVGGLAMVQVAAFDAPAAAAAIAEATGAAASMTRGGVGVSGRTRVLWTGPGRWLVVEPEHRDLARLLAARCPPALAAVTDLSQGRSVMRIDGAACRWLLPKLCTLDFDPRMFPPDTCMQTQLGQIGALIDCRAADTFDIAVYRGFAVSAWEMLTDAALEFGYQTE